MLDCRGRLYPQPNGNGKYSGQHSGAVQPNVLHGCLNLLDPPLLSQFVLEGVDWYVQPAINFEVLPPGVANDALFLHNSGLVL